MSKDEIRRVEVLVGEYAELGYHRAAQELAEKFNNAGYLVHYWPEFILDDILDTDVVLP